EPRPPGAHGDRSGARRTADLRRAHRAQEHLAGWVRATRSRCRAPGSAARVRIFPAPARAAAAAGRNAERRRAADARHRTGPHGPATNARAPRDIPWALPRLWRRELF